MAFNCIRKECIEDEGDAYHYEAHKCFVCGSGFMPTVHMTEDEQCPECGWLICQACGCCKCDLQPEDQEWIDHVFETYCHSVVAMSRIGLNSLSATTNPHVRDGLGMQLAFCKRWAAVRTGLCTDDH